jgi:glycosyltransferase involved in cell wall biosynthesis
VSGVKILLVTPRFAPDVGGIESVVLRQASELVRAGHEVTVATQGRRGLPRQDLVHAFGADIAVRRATCAPGLPAELPAPGLYQLVRDLADGVDIVHAHSYHTLVAPTAALAAGTTPLVLSLHYHGGGHDRLRSLAHHLYRPLGRRLVRRADLVLANSAAERSMVVSHFDRQLRRPPALLAHGVELPDAGGPFETTRPVVLAVCRLEAYKGVDTLIAASQQWRSPSELVIVGDGVERDRLETLAAASGGSARLVGRVSDDDLARWWATASVVVSASREESFSLTVAQARASGVRVVASDIDAHRELLVQRAGAMLVPVGDAAGFAAAVDQILAAPAPERESFANWTGNARRLVELYQSVLVGPR